MISVTILAKNSEKHIRQVLEALKSFDEVLLGDTGSTDNTLEIASEFSNVKIVLLPFMGFGKTHNNLAMYAKNEWIFSVDSDEVADVSLIKEIHRLDLDNNVVYSVPRKNYYKGIWIKTCGWYPDRVIRLYNRKKTEFSESLVHESVIGKQEIPLDNHLSHFPYDKIADFLSKMQLYTDLYAKQNKGKKSGYGKAIGHGLFSFFRAYIIKCGFLQKGPGFEISFYNGVTAFYKYLKLMEVNSIS